MQEKENREKDRHTYLRKTYRNTSTYGIRRLETSLQQKWCEKRNMNSLKKKKNDGRCVHLEIELEPYY